jgi:two-component system, NarL family, response regulator NreC
LFERAFVPAHVQIEREKMFGEQKIRCILVHDYVLLRQGLRRVLADAPDVVVAGEAGSISDALPMIAELRPDVVITDAATFGSSADRVEKLIAEESPLSGVIFLPAEENEGASRDGGRNATRHTSGQELIEILRRLCSSERAVVREMPRRNREEWPAEKVRSRKRGLTTREREVLELLAGGRTVRSAAKTLGLSVKTVDAHKFNLMRKLGIHNKAELVMWAIQKRILRLPANF